MANRAKYSTPQIDIWVNESRIYSNGENPIIMRFYFEGKRRYLSLGISTDIKKWNIAKCEPKAENRKYKTITETIKEYRTKFDKALADLKQIKEPPTINRIIELMKIENNNNIIQPLSVNEYLEIFISNLTANGKAGTSTAFKDLKRILNKFDSNFSNLQFHQIDIAYIKNLVTLLRKDKKNKDVTISIYLRGLRSLFNHAIQDKRTLQVYYPFGRGRYSIADELNTTTTKDALSIAHIRQIEALELDKTLERKQYFAKLVFLSIYYGSGINFTDLALLKWSDISHDENENDRLFTYIRSKTGKEITVPIIPKLAKIFDSLHYEGNCSAESYIYPILDVDIHTNATTIHNRIHKMKGEVNKALKDIQKLCGFKVNLTTYVARHTMARVTYANTKDISGLQKLLGHDKITTTQGYLGGAINQEKNRQMTKDL